MKFYFFPLIAGLILYAFLSWYKPKYALGLILIALPAYQIKFQIFGIPFTLLEAMIIVLFVCRTIKQFNNLTIKQLNNSLNGWKWLILGWLFISTVSMFIAPDLRAAAGVWKAYFIEPVLFLMIFIDLIKNRQDFRIVYAAIFFLVFGLGLVVFYQKLIGQGVLSLEDLGSDKIVRMTGLFSHPNFLGLFLGPLIVLAFGGIAGFGLKKFLTPLNSFILLFFSRSEGAIIGVAAGLVFLGIVLKKSRKYVLIGLAAVILLTAVYPLPRRYFSEKAFLRDLSGQFRLNIWQGAVSLLKTSPILGVGLDGYEKLVPDYQSKNFIADNGEKLFAPVQPYPHNLLLTVWLEMGLAGLAVFLWTVIKFFKRGFDNFKKAPILTASIMGAMICVLVHGLVDTPYFKNDLAVIFWLIIGLMIILNKNNFENDETEIFVK